MPTVTPNLGLKKPLGNETVSRAAYNENLDILDEAAASADDLAAHLADTMPHKFTDGATAYRWGLSVVGGVVMFNYEEVV